MAASNNGSPSRRQVLEGAVATGLFAAFGSGLLAKGALAQSTPTELVSASHWGAFKATTDGKRVTKVVAHEKDLFPSRCLPGVTDVMYSPSRIKYPMVRASYLKDGIKADRSKRGAEEFVRVSWDKAIELVAKEVERVQSAHGGQAIYAGSYGWKSTGKLHNARSLLQRYMNVLGKGFVSHTGDYSTGASQVIMPHVVGRLEVYEQQTAWPVVVANSQIVVIWGADPINTNQIGWLVPEHGGYEGMKALKESGKKVIVIDPVRTETVDYFNAQWVPVRPQTDVAVMLGMAHTIFTEKLHDEKFLKDYTVGFEQFLPYLMGEKDKTPKTAEWAEKISEVPADLIKELARTFAKNRTMLMSGWSMQRQHHGEQPHWMLVTLACMLGQIGLPGGGFGLSYHYSNGGTPQTDCPALSGITSGAKAGATPWLETAGSAAIPLARVVEMLESPGKVIDFNGKRITYPDVKLAYWVGGNPFAHHQDRNRMIKAWQKLDTFIVHDFQWTPTARMADIVLPATTSFERDDIEQVGDYSLRGIVAMKKLVEPMFEAKSDYDIFRLLSAAAGKEKDFTEGKTSDLDWVRSFYEAAAKLGQTKKVAMPSFDDFWKSGYLDFPASEAGKKFVRFGEFREDPVFNAVGTPSGKIEIYSKNIEKMAYDDCPAHPTWMEPLEWLGGEKAKTYPMHVVTKHPRYRLHSQLCGTVLRKEYAVKDRAPLWINPKDAAERNIKDGDIVRVFNDRGQILAGAIVTDKVRPSCVICEEGNWYDPADPAKPGSICKFGDPNVLTPDIGTSKLAQGNCGHTVIAQVEKYKGDAPAVTVFTEPKIKA